MRVFDRSSLSKIPTTFVCLVSLTIIGFSPLLLVRPASALAISSSRDCDSNAVINCGAMTVNELQQKYNNQADVHTIYHSFGITHIDIAAMDSTAVEGRVTSGGRVLLNGQAVATDAVTAGRQNMSGSGQQTINGVTFFTRPPSVSFQQSSLPAFVVMKNGQFQFAIIASCGNPVKATPVVKKQVSKTSPAAVVTPPPAVTQTQSQSQSVVVNAPTPVVPAPAPTPAPAPQPQPQVLPNTGVGDMAGFGSFVALVSASAHFLIKRRLLS